MTRLLILALGAALVVACTPQTDVTDPDPVVATAGTAADTPAPATPGPGPTTVEPQATSAAQTPGTLSPVSPPSPADDGLAQPLAPPTAATTTTAPTTDPGAVPPGLQEAVVTWIIDGDTIDVEVVTEGEVPPGDQRIRLLEIDTPERDDDCYETATDVLADYIPVGSTVYLERDVENLDPNGRYLRYIWSETEGLVNVHMVAEGMAEAFIFPLNRLHEREVLAAEEEAQDLGLGIWGSYCDGRP